MENTIKKFRSIIREFIKSDKKKFKKVITEYGDLLDEELKAKISLMELDKNIADFYLLFDGLKVSWDFDLKRSLCGRMDIIKLGYVLESWEEKLYYEGADERLKYFRPLDIFTEEACCGILLDGSGDNRMYYHEFGDGKLYSLDIDFRAYFDLAIEARVFLYWQTYLVELVHGNQGVEPLFKAGMKEVFPNFDLGVFTSKFESLRLSI